MLTITDVFALVHEGPPDFRQTGQRIPIGTRIDVLETAVRDDVTYAHVANHDSGEPLGWMLPSKAQDLAGVFNAAGATHVYLAAAHPVMVYLPARGIARENLEVFMFFHGIGGNYAATTTNKCDGGYVDNTGISADLPQAVDASGRNLIAIGVQAINSRNPEWHDIPPADYKAMLDTVLAYLRVDLQWPQPLEPVRVSLAGHSAGGKALGPAALGLDAGDVTLLDAGYGYDSYQSSWRQLRTWFVTGKPVKQLRIVSKDAPSQDGSVVVDNTRHAQYVELGQDAIRDLATSQQSGDVALEAVDPDPATPRDAGLTLDGGFDLQINGDLQGCLRVFAIVPRAQGTQAHWGVKDETMQATLSAGDANDDFAKLA